MEIHREQSNFEAYGVPYRRDQLPIQNAHGLSIHKVQGLSMSSITIKLDETIFAPGQAYVALSRATSLDTMYLSRLEFAAIKADPEALAEVHRLETVARNHSLHFQSLTTRR